jgi:hypothetical protein
MIYRRPGFLAVVWFGSSPTISPSLKNCERKLADGRRGKGVG